MSGSKIIVVTKDKPDWNLLMFANYMSVRLGFHLGMQIGSLIMELNEIEPRSTYALRGVGSTLSRNILEARSDMCPRGLRV